MYNVVREQLCTKDTHMQCITDYPCFMLKIIQHVQALYGSLQKNEPFCAQRPKLIGNERPIYNASY